jgi:hypothetical protein
VTADDRAPDRTPLAAHPGLAGPLAAPRRLLLRDVHPAAAPLLAARWAVGVGVTGLRWTARLPWIARAGAPDRPVPPAPTDLAGDPAPVQTRADGHGPLHHRVYRVRIRDAQTTPEALFAAVVADLNAVSPVAMARWEKTRGEDGPPALGDEYVVHLAGPWEGPVRVVERTPTFFRVVTLRGHMEAGENAFRALRDDDGRLVFEIETSARCGDPLFRLLYEPLWIGRELQLQQWSHVCARVAERSAGRRVGRIEVRTATHAADAPEVTRA